MKLPKTLVLLLSMLCLPAHADTWICTAEQAAFVVDQAGEIVGATAIESAQVFEVSENGVKNFGSDSVTLDVCQFKGGRPLFCSGSVTRQWGWFRMSIDNVFTIIGTMQDDDVTSDIVIKGKCSKI